MIKTASLAEIPVNEGIEGTIENLISELSPEEMAGTMSGICNPTEELDQLRSELTGLRRRHAAMTARLSHLQEDLAEAADVQQAIEQTPLPTLKNSRILRLQKPAESVTGDLCHVERLDDHTIALALADATGHGVAAAMLTAFCRPMLRQQQNPSDSPADINPASVLGRLNEAICALELTGCQFITAVFAVYDENTGIIRWSRAGAPYPIHVGSETGPEMLAGDGPLLGMMEEAIYECRVMQLQPGDRFLLHTDGLESLMQQPLVSTRNGGVGASSWLNGLKIDDPQTLLDDLNGQLHEIDHQRWEADDVSILVLAMDE
ncbi:MAG: PP2C family protein-serine/threonine phosphatase [Planctomycetota bacterium]|jgi:sigma-B regulation protein RsbU (phosphoserine phosphatase)